MPAAFAVKVATDEQFEFIPMLEVTLVVAQLPISPAENVNMQESS